jgi:hypothetical protein
LPGSFEVRPRPGQSAEPRLGRGRPLPAGLQPGLGGGLVVHSLRLAAQPIGDLVGTRHGALEGIGQGLPARWIQLMRNSISSTIWRFSTTRMLHEYVERLYLPAAAAGAELAPASSGAASGS